MDKIQIAKIVTSTIVGMGTSRIAGQIVKNNVVPKNVIDKVTIVGASVVIGSMASAATKAHTGEIIDEMVEAFEKIKDQNNL